ncbi:MAG: Holliday junction resolvase RuvX [Myxococcota bacterium]
MQGPVLGLDLGARRIGLAVSDEDATIAFPVGCLERHGLEKDLAALGELIRERSIRAIAIGLPLHMDGRAGSGAEAARRFATALTEATELPVELVDERWTTAQAERTLRDAPASKRRRKGEVDALAATLILRTYLEQPREGAP